MKRLPAAALATLATAGVAALFIAFTATFAIRTFETYGYSLFLGVPFAGGALATLLLSRSGKPRGWDVFVVTTSTGGLSP